MASGVVGALKVILGLDSAQFTKGLSKSEQAIRKFQSDLGTAFGKQGPLGQIGTLLKGGGALAGATLLAREVEKMAKATSEASIALSNGQITMREFLGEALRGVPVLGDFTRAFDAIGSAARDAASAFTGGWISMSEAARLAPLEVAANDANTFFDELQRIRDVVQPLSDLEKINRQIDNAMRLPGASRGGIAELERLRGLAQTAQVFNETEENMRALAEGHKAYEKTMLDMVRAAEKEARQIGMTRRERALDDAIRAGATEEYLKQIDASHKLIEAHDKEVASLKKVAEAERRATEERKRNNEEIRRSTETLLQSIETPTQSLQRFAKEAARSLFAGGIGLGQFEQLIRNRARDLFGGVADTANLAPPALLRGSQAAITAERVNFQAVDARNKAEERIEQEVRRQTKPIEDAARDLREIVTRLGGVANF